MQNTSHGKGRSYYKISEYDCDYFYEYGIAKKFHKKRNPCTNIFVRCEVPGCLTDVWKYNYKKHFQEKHQGDENVDFPDSMIITEEEKKFILSQ